jgi:hypothetical protein
MKVPFPDAEEHYCWVPVTDQLMWARYMLDGYKPVIGEHAIRLYGKELYEQVRDASGLVRLRELALTYIPRSLKMQWEIEAARENARMRNMNQEEFMRSIEALGPAFKAFITSHGEYADLKEFETRESNNRVSLAGLNVPKSDEPSATPPTVTGTTTKGG